MGYVFAIAILALALPVAHAQFEASERMQADLQSVEVPAGERLVLKAEASGVQIYRCDGKQWTFVAPEARLYALGVEVASHGAGPMWRSIDGSTVWGEVLANAPSPHEGAIPLLLLKAARSEGTGIFTTVNFIQRMDTNGGSAPASGCDASQQRAEIRVNYSATYLFYAPR